MSACVSTQSPRATTRTAALLASWNTIPLSARTLCLAIQAPPLCLSRYCRVVFNVPNSVECLECVGLLGELAAERAAWRKKGTTSLNPLFAKSTPDLCASTLRLISEGETEYK